jgi:chromate transporter
VAGPTSVLTFIGSGLWYRFRDARWRRLVQAGLMPVTAGLVMPSAALLIRTTSAEWGTATISIVAMLLLLFTRLHPLLVLGAAAALGATGLLT